MAKIKRIGIIAEDDSDFQSSVILIKRIIKKDNIGFRKALGNGCGKLKRKSQAYAQALLNRGCNLLIIIHDRDRNHASALEQELHSAIAPCPIKNYFVCIPVEEFEAWLLSDPDAIKKVFNLRKLPRISTKPEEVSSPKEYLAKLIYLSSNKEKIYLNTRHNQVLAEHLTIDTVSKRCQSFKSLCDFLKAHSF